MTETGGESFEEKNCGADRAAGSPADGLQRVRNGDSGNPSGNRRAGGNGGGKPNIAMAGGKDLTKADEALYATKGIVEKMIG